MRTTLMLATSRILCAAVAVVLAAAPASAADPAQVRVETSAGNFVVQLDPARAPLSVANFLAYMEAGHYTGLTFHRVVDGFVVQGGGYTPDMELRPVRAPIPNEAGNGLSNRRGTVAMARTSDPHSADSQFYVNLADNLDLDPKPTRWGYAVFGLVVEGMEVVDEIGHRATTSRNAMNEVPVEPVVIRAIKPVTERVPR
jgi:cyclophilin family peptidyl-prolyl cis-trans isomerase